MKSNIFLTSILILLSFRFYCGFRIGWRKLVLNERYRLGTHTTQQNKPTEIFKKKFLEGFQKLVLHYSDVVFIVGEANVGRSSLATYLTQQKLTSIEDFGIYYLKDEHGRIGDLHPWTIYPELFLDEVNKIAYYELPGHSVTNDAAFETISKFFIYELLRFVKYIRILIVFDYNKFNTPDKIIQQIEATVGNFFNTDKLKNFYTSIGLVISKIDFVQDGQMISDIEVKKHIRNLLNKCYTLADRKYENNQYKNDIKLLIKHLSENYEKTVLFRSPFEAGNVYDLPTHAAENLPSVTNQIENINTFRVSTKLYSIFKYDFIAEPEETRIFAGSAIDTINECFNNITVFIKSHFTEIIKNSVNHVMTIKIFERWIAIFKEALPEIEYSCDNIRNNCVNKLFEKFKDMKFKLPQKYEFQIKAFLKYLQFIEFMGKFKIFILKTKEWVHKIKEINNYLMFSKSYLETLLVYQSVKSKNTFQTQNKKKFKISKNPCCGNFVLKKSKPMNIGILEKVFIDKNLPNIEIEQNSHLADDSHVNQTEESETIAKLVNVNYNCYNKWNGAKILQIKGLYLHFNYISQYFQFINLKEFCKGTVERIEFFALDSIVINMDLKDLFPISLSPMEVAIISTTWNILLPVNLNLNGKHGVYRDTGTKVGVPGNPGSPAYGFLGIGTQFENMGLTITSFGGNGARGADGLIGDKGIDGQYLAETINCTPYKCYYSGIYKKWNGGRYLIKYNDIREIACTLFLCLEGIKATVGKAGGDGGRGGYPGYGNEINIISLEKNPHFIMKYSGMGRNGTNGTGEFGGDGGVHEMSFVVWRIFFFYVFDHIIFRFAWPTILADRGPRGIDGNNTENIKLAEEPIPVLYKHEIVNNYKSFLIESLLYRTKRSEFLKFYNNLEKNEQVEDFYTVIGYSQNFIKLENHFLKMNKFAEYIDFYKSLSHRLNNFDANKVDMYEGKTIDLSQKKFRPLTEHEINVARNNNRVAIAILNATLLRKLNYLINKRHKISVFLDVVPYLKQLNETVYSYYNLEHSSFQRKETKSQIFKLVEKLNTMKNSIDKVLKPMFINIMKNIKQGVYSLVEEIDKKIEEIKDEMQKQRLAILIKTIIGVIAAILSFIPGIGTVGSLAVIAAGEIGKAITDIAIPPGSTPLPQGVENSQTNLDFVNENLTRTLDAVQKYKKKIESEIAKRSVDQSELKKKHDELKIIENTIAQAKTNKISESEKDPINYITGELNSVLLNTKGTKKGFHIKDIYKALYKSGLINLSYEKFERFTGNVTEIIKDIKRFVKSLKKNRIWKYMMKSLKLSNSKFLNLVFNTMDKFTKILEWGIQHLKLFFKFFSKILPFFGIVPDVDANGQTLKELSEQIIQLTHFKRQILESTVPMLDKFTNTVESIDFMEISMETYTNILLCAERLKNELSKMTEGFKTASIMTTYVTHLSTVLKKFEEQISDIEDAKLEMQDLQSQDNVVADKIADQIKNNSNLREIVDNVKLANTKNSIVTTYEIAIRTVDILFFPHPNKYYVSYDLMLKKDKFLEYVKKVEASIESMIGNYNKTICKANIKYFSNNYTNPEAVPFFSWYQNVQSDGINKLLTGQEIIMYSDAKNIRHKYHAIKFREIGIEFTLKLNYSLGEKKIFNDAIKKLSKCIVNLTMHGDLMYKCSNKFYKVSGKVLSFAHSYSEVVKNKISPCPEKEYVFENKEYALLKKVPHILSPYSTWNISIKCRDDQYLKQLINLVDLHLTGSAIYSLVDDCPEKIERFDKQHD